MNSEQNDKIRRFCKLTAGAVTYGAEQITRLTKRAYGAAKEVWDKHEDEREKIKMHLLAYKAEFIDFLEKRGKKAADFDKILESLDSLSEEELKKLKEILQNF